VDYSKSSESSPLNTERVAHMEGAQLIVRHEEATIFTLRQLAEATKNFRRTIFWGEEDLVVSTKQLLVMGRFVVSVHVSHCFILVMLRAHYSFARKHYTAYLLLMLLRNISFF